MLNRILTITITLVFTVTGLLVAEYSKSYVFNFFNYSLENSGILANVIAIVISVAIGILLFGGMGYALSPSIISYTLRYTEAIATVLSKLPSEDIISVALGVVVGLVVANLFGAPFSHLPIVGAYVPLVLSLVFAIIGAKVALRKRTDIVSFLTRVSPLKSSKDSTKKIAVRSDSCTYKILDTSVLIDGRIVDILKTGFMEGTIVIPKFVLEELQKIADSPDTLKRNRGRRGLDIVKEIQQDGISKVEISTKDYEDINEVDAKLVLLAKDIGGVVATNDYNLSKVAEIQGVRILNINDLANAVKPAVLPGEELIVYLAKEGKEHGQAIAYLDDGTMIVVESGKQAVNSNVAVIVTSVLQTSAGRMIFAKIK